MDMPRIRHEIAEAQAQFSNVELRANLNQTLYVKIALQTSAGNVYTASIALDGYPTCLPGVRIDQPTLHSSVPHRYQSGLICYQHPSVWNPGLHNLTHVIARTAKWLNKYEVWRQKGSWPGAELLH